MLELRINTLGHMLMMVNSLELFKLCDLQIGSHINKGFTLYQWGEKSTIPNV